MLYAVSSEVRSLDGNAVMALNKGSRSSNIAVMLNSSTCTQLQPSGHHPEGGGRPGAGAGSPAGHTGGWAGTALPRCLLSSLLKSPPVRARICARPALICIHPTQDKRLRRLSPQGLSRNWGTMHKTRRPQ